MPMTDYRMFPDKFIGGQIYSIGEVERRTRLNLTNAVLPYGFGVVQSPTVQDGCVLPSGSNTNFLGVVERKYTYENEIFASLYYGFPAKADVDIVREGEIVVYVEEAIALGDAVFCRHTANGAGKLYPGQFRNDADSSNCFQITNARWLTSTTAAGLAVLSLNLA